MNKESPTQSYRHRGNMDKAKMHRKILYLRSTNKPNFEGGATKYSWGAFWSTLYKLRLISKFHRGY